MSEARIAERIDANLLDVKMQDLQSLSKDMYDKKIKNLKSKSVGRFIIKEYPTASASVTHFRSLLNELSLKKNFVPDAIFVDYLNIASSSRISNTNNTNSYSYIKSIAEEFRGLAVEYDLPIWTATQTNRQGYTSTDIGLENTSECIFVDETVELRDGTSKRIGEIQVGEQIKSNDEYKTVMMVHHKKIKPCYQITLKSGKKIVVSEDHVFPTNKGRQSIKSGLKPGLKLNTKD